MSDAVEVAIIISIAPTIAAGVAAWFAFHNRQRLEKVVKTGVAIEQKVDGRFTELLNALLKLTKESSFIAGGQAEKDREK